MLLSPGIRASSSKARLRKLKLKPHLKRSGSSYHHPNKLIFSVDDDIGDTIHETDDNLDDRDKETTEYNEGYSAAIRDLLLQGKRPSQSYFADVSTKSAGPEPEESSDDNEETEVPADSESVHSASSVESLNLKERQNAINTTHPFGIKIWKPSLYKKKRSVAARAEEDIHDFDPRKPTTYRIFWGVKVTNVLWALTIGLLVYVVCVLGALVVFVMSGFAIHSHSRPYVKLLLKLGRYWLYPFGKFVLLNRDENYLDEDELDGRSILEFHRWRLQEEGRLFYAPPRRFTSSTEARPTMLKDHRGRPLNDTYTLTEQDLLDQTGQNLLGPRAELLAPQTETGESTFEDSDTEEDNGTKVRFFGRGSWSSGRLAFYLVFYGILQPFFYIVGLFCWMIVFTIPMAKISMTMCDHLRRHPLALDFEVEKDFYKRNDNEGLLGSSKKRKHQLIIMCTYRCCGWHYYKYTIDGTNIFFINLLSVVIFVILDYYFLREHLGWDTWFTDPLFLFGACLFSIIPLAYFIGQAVASISAQSSMGVGAVINAFFSTIVEIFLYCVALNQSKGKLVEGSMIGSILGGVLLLPGLSMIGGAFKRKTQRYNPRSAGVSSTMLLFAMVIMFAPSLFYQIYGAYEIRCKVCKEGDTVMPGWSGGSGSVALGSALMSAGGGGNFADDCTKCRFIQPSFLLDRLYYDVIQPFSLIVALALFAAYVCGLIFTLRTHALLIWATNSHEAAALSSNKDESYFRSPSITPTDIANHMEGLKSILPPNANVPEPRGRTGPSDSGHREGHASHSEVTSPAVEFAKNKPRKSASVRRTSLLNNAQDAKEEDDDSAGGHDAPNWSRNKSTVILLGATLMYAIIAEILVDNVDFVLADFPIDPKFLGLTVFALVPNTTEFLNAILFATSGNVALSMEIGSAYALQVVLIQIPSLVLFTIYKGFSEVENMFALVFPRWDIIATLISIYLFTYIYAEGKSNYFKGVILILIYVVVLIGFWFNDRIEALDDYVMRPKMW